MPELTVVLPTRDRGDILIEAVERLRATAADAPIELVVVNDGSTDGSAERLAASASRLPWPLWVLEQDGRGPAAARNRGIEAARADVCLLIGDDTWARPGMVKRHLDFHRSRPEATEALLGRVVPAPPLDSSPFVRWLHEQGTQFGYALLDPARTVPPECFWTSNVSVKRRLVLEAGGFDEGFPAAACEDTELGLRMARRGMRLSFDPEAVAEHYHPTDLERTLARMRKVGIAYRRLCELAPEMPRPPRPRARHRLKAGALTVLMAARIRPPKVRESAWRFLCDQVQRESFWGVSEGVGDSPVIGARLARLAASDPLSRPGTHHQS